MYIRCSYCGWSQDDFWDKSYNPIRSLTYWEDCLLNKPTELFNGEKDTEAMNYANVIAREADGVAKTIRHMKYHTLGDYKQAQENGTLKCPDCGKINSFIKD